MKQKKRCFMLAALYEQETIVKKLEDMAAQGWMIEKTANLFWTFRRIEPKKLRFAVTYYPKASEFDPQPSEGQLTKEAYCAQDGWQVAVRWDVMQIFYTEEENPVPIETDPVMQVRNIERVMKKKLLTGQGIFLLLLLFQLVQQWTQLQREPAAYLSDIYHMLSIPIWLLLILAEVIEILRYLIWLRRAKKAAADGWFFSAKNRPWVTPCLVLLALALMLLSWCSLGSALPFFVIWAVLFTAIVLLSQQITYRLKKEGASRGTNIALTIGSVVLMTIVFMSVLVALVISGEDIFFEDSKAVGTYEWEGMTWEIYDDPLPLTVEQLMEVEADYNRQAQEQETFLVFRGKYQQRTLYTEEIQNADLSYTIVDVKIPLLSPYIKEGMLGMRQDEVHGDVLFTDHYEPIDPALWGAEEAYQLHWSNTVQHTYLICWENRFVEITFYWEPTGEQIAAAGEILRPKEA